MKYFIIIDMNTVKKLESEGRFIEASQMLIDDVKHNYQRIPETERASVKECYDAISFLGKDNGLSPETEKRILHLVAKLRERFKQQFELIHQRNGEVIR